MSLIYLSSLILLVIVILYISSQLLKHRRRKHSIGIFHLHCSSGGGGEGVLWHLINKIVNCYPTFSVNIYTSNNLIDKDKILMGVNKRFNIDLSSSKHRLHLIPLRSSILVSPEIYPFLTLLFQNLGSILVSLEAAFYLIPWVYFETIGFSFTIPIFKLHQCKTIAYVHYPTISTDMIEKVEINVHPSYNNRGVFVRSSLMRQLKLKYYQLLAKLYGYSGKVTDLVMVNSSWTCGHIKSLWKVEPHIVFPPCNIESFRTLRIDRFVSLKQSGLRIVSIAQYRPEKNHVMQIMAFYKFILLTKSESTLTMFGSCRGPEDERRADELEELVHKLNIEGKVKIRRESSFDELLVGLSNADVAIHTMENEHFGMVLLECMAAGLIMIAHNSGGPKMDIIDEGYNGFLAHDEDEFAEKLAFVNSMRLADRQKIRLNAISKSLNFSVYVFGDMIEKLCEPLIVST